jgi:hypothetical protein
VRRGIGALVAAVAGGAAGSWPAVALACASCLTSAYGDRTFTWPFLGLMAAPFAVMAVIGAILARSHYRSRDKERT